MTYRVRSSFELDVGFRVTADDVLHAVELSNGILEALPSSLYRSLAFKTTSAILGAVFCEALADRVDAIVNPIEKGHPDIVPRSAKSSSEAVLRNYPQGLELKTTIGNIAQGANLRAGEKRVEHVTGITWQAHHRDVRELMGLVWDFCEEHESFTYPGITGIFYSPLLEVEDWGAISGTTGRNTKVTGMRVSGKQKMADGWVLVKDDPQYLAMFRRILRVDC